MKKNLLFIFAALFIFSAQAQNTLKLMSYNIKNANGMDNVCNFQRIANVINNTSPDVVAIQEVDSMTNRSGQKYVLGEIAERTQMHGYFAPAIDYDGGKYGIGLLTKQVPLRLQSLPLPGVYSPIPMGAFYTVAKLPVDDSDKFCAWCLSDFEYEGQTVFMAPASGFYTTPGSGINEVRIAYVLKKEDLTRALFVLQKALEAYPGRTE